MRKIGASIFVSLLATAAANAAEIYAVNNLGGTPAGSDGTLIRFDSANPAAWVTIGSLGQPTLGMGGLDFDGAGNLYCYASYLTAGGTASGLYSVNTTTGAATLIGNSGQSLQDLAWNPADNMMYGINSVTNVARLYRVNLTNGTTALVGTITGLPATNLEVGLACDSAGNFYVHDIASDRIFKGTALAMTSSILLTRNTNFSQGMTIDWSRNDQGFHAAIGNTPAFFSHLYTFNTTLTAWTDLGTFGIPDGTFPTVEGGDLAIRPEQPNCPGDVDSDGDVDLTDLSTLLTNFGTPSGAMRDDGDLDGDGDVDLSDLSQLLSNFGATCP
jgi:Domain of unknown function (DUF4394)